MPCGEFDRIEWWGRLYMTNGYWLGYWESIDEVLLKLAVDVMNLWNTLKALE